MSIRPVLILGLEPRVTLTVARSLHRRRIPVVVGEFASTRELADGPRLFSRAVKRSVLLPDAHTLPREFRAALSGLIRDEGIDMLIPCGDPALAAVAALHEELAGQLHIACPPAHVVRRVLDNAQTLEFAERCGIPIPLTRLLAGSADLAGLRDTLHFPVISKPRNKAPASASTVRYFADFESLSQAFQEEATPECPLLVQEYCPGGGVGVSVLIHGGEAIAIFQHGRLKEVPSTGGMSAMAVSEPVDRQLGDWSLSLLRSLEWQGVAMVEFRRDPATGRVALMEVNGRYWGALAAAVHAGVDFPYYEWQLAHGSRPKVPVEYRVGLRTRWTVGDFKRLRGLMLESESDDRPRPSRSREALRFLLDFRPSTREALWSMADPFPAWIELGRALRRAAITDAKRLIRRVLPRDVRWHADARHRLPPRPRRVSLAMQLARTLGVRRDRPRKLPRGVRNVLFVCEGNILRSPIAAALFGLRLSRAGREDVSVVSAGIGAIPDREADPRGVEVAKEFGVSLEDHRASRLSREMVERADAIFVMDRFNEAKLLAQYPRALGKLSLLGNWAERAPGGRADIADPVLGGVEDIRASDVVIESAISRLAANLLSTSP